VYAKVASPKGEKTTKIVAAAHDLQAGTRLKKSDLKKINVAEKDVPATSFLDEAQVLDRALLFPVNTNEAISRTKVAAMGGAEGLSATIEQGKRAISVPITDSSSAGGLIQPRSHVDVLFTRTGSMREALTTTVLQDVIVLSIGKQTEVSTTPVDPRVNRPTTQAATLMVTPEQAQKLELAKNQGRISLALRNPLDRSVGEESGAATAETLNPMLFSGIQRNVRGATPNIRNNKVWGDLTGDGNGAPAKAKEEKKEPVRPRLIIDVYRGDKHVQEIFQ
jgi:pilus assembly protein CpaB